MESSSEEVSAPKKAPRKRASSAASRAPRKTAAKKPAAKRAPRKTAPASERVERVERASSSPASGRKAPTPIASSQAAKKRKQVQLIVVAASMVVGIGASALVGFTDQGQIDVQKTIEDRNERIRTNTTDERDINTSLVKVPVQNTTGKADGGLVGKGKTEKPLVPAVVASSTATSSDQTASSTEATSTSSEASIEESEPFSGDEILDQSPADDAPVPDDAADSTESAL